MRPATLEEAAETVGDIGRAGSPVVIRGGGTKRSWGGRGGLPEIETGGMNRVLEHNVGDLTAVLEPGVTLREAQRRFAAAGQMLAVDPPEGPSTGGQTVGGLIAAADSGPLRHRYGSVRDLVIGMTVVLSDGTASRSGGKVIKNVAGYDVAKLFAGSHGSLGLIASVTVRLHPRSPMSATAVGVSSDSRRLAEAAALVTRLPLEAECLDVYWEEGRGELLIRLAGVAASERVDDACVELERVGLADVRSVGDDEPLWDRQRRLQRHESGLVIKLAGLPSDLPLVLELANRNGGRAVSRAALGVTFLSFPARPNLDGTVAAIRQALESRSCTILDGSALVRESPWPAVDPGAAAVMTRIKARLDPSGVFAPIPIERPM